MFRIVGIRTGANRKWVLGFSVEIIPDFGIFFLKFCHGENDSILRRKGKDWFDNLPDLT